MPIFIYLDRRGETDKLIGFGSFDEAANWFEANEPEGVAFEYPEYELVPFEDSTAIDWRTVLKDGSPVWHGPEQACLRFVSDPVFREECLRSKSLKPGR